MERRSLEERQRLPGRCGTVRSGLDAGRVAVATRAGHQVLGAAHRHSGLVGFADLVAGVAVAGHVRLVVTRQWVNASTGTE